MFTVSYIYFLFYCFIIFYYSQFQVKHKMPTDLDKVKTKINNLGESMVNSERKIELINQKLNNLIECLKKYEGEINEN